MIEETAKVVEVNDNHVVVESLVKSSCSGCQQVDNCGSGQISKALPHRKLTLSFTNELALKTGDLVVIGLPEEKLLHSAWQVYCLPILGLFIFALLGKLLSEYWLLDHETLIIFLSFLGGYFGFLTAQRLQSRLSVKANLTPRIMRKQVETIKVT